MKTISISDELYDRLQEELEGREDNATMESVIGEYLNKPDPSTAVISFVLDNHFELDEPMTFLQLWYEGEFDRLREEWDDLEIPDSVFIGADTLFVPKPDSD